MSARTRTATVMAFRDQLRRPLVPILLVIVPAFIVLWSVATTRPTPRRIGLPGGLEVMTTMKDIHGPGMAALTVAFVAGLLGVFVMQSALRGDRRLVVAGFRPGEAVVARLTVVVAATLVAVAVSAVAISVNFTPASWVPVLTALMLMGLVYAAIGALAGAILDKLAATYLILFIVMADSIVQSPMFSTTPARWAVLLPGYAPMRVLYDGAYLRTFTAAGDLLLALSWSAALSIIVWLVLRRTLGTARNPHEGSRPPSLDLHAQIRSS